MSDWSKTDLDRNNFDRGYFYDTRNKKVLCDSVPVTLQLLNQGGNKFLYLFFHEGYDFTVGISDEIYNTLSETVKSDNDE